MTETDATSAFVLGLDGIPWNLVDRWTADGSLPNFERLRAEGASGPCTSTTPATTPVAWPSIATGVGADKHGVYGFQNLSSKHRHTMNTSRDVRQPRLWDVLSPSVVANVPMTYPATEIDGTMVAGMLTPDVDDQFTHPPSFADELEESIEDYRISLDWGAYADRKDEFLDAFQGLVTSRRELMQLLMDRNDDWQLFFFVYTAPDRLQHLFWDEDLIREHYQQLDEILGEVMAYVAERDANLFVVSDHGFGPTEQFVYVNRLLEQAGYLSELELTGSRSAFARVGIERDDVKRFLGRLGIDEKRLVSMLPRTLLDRVAETMPGDHGLYDIDFGRTQVFLHESGGVYVNDTERFDGGIVDPADVPRIKRAVMSLLESAVDPDTGDRLLEVSDGSTLFPTADVAPDLVVSGTDGYMTKNGLGDAVVGPVGTMNASHRDEGILLAWGPSIEPGSTPRAATVYDVAPTLLHSIGEPVSDATDGRVLDELFRADSVAATTPTKTIAYDEVDSAERTVDEDLEDVEERLKGLGYMQ
jgi:predicted AlkP superfamily phosphohydrolase/phosphomutase